VEGSKPNLFQGNTEATNEQSIAGPNSTSRFLEYDAGVTTHPLNREVHY